MRSSGFGFLLGLAVGTFLVASGLPGRGPARREAPAVPPTPAIVVRPSPQALPAPAAKELFLLAHVADDGTWSELHLVEDGRVRSLRLPADVDRTALPRTDGRRIYAYVGGSSVPGAAYSRERRLAAFSLDGQEEETITDSTPLVVPRGLFLSPTGTVLAFFLDSRQTSDTELWTYDTTERTKRVSVERLSREELTGPFFAPDGGFLLRQGDQLLGGSPRRTGVDILSGVQPVLEAQWEAGAARSPDGEQVVLVTESGVPTANVRDVVVHGAQRPTRPAKLFTTVGDVRVLGWWGPSGRRGSPRSRLVLASRAEKETTVWTLDDGQRRAHPLADAGSLAVSGDGEAVGVLARRGAAVRLSVLDLGHASARPVAEFPRPEAGSSLSSPRPEDAGTLRLLQYLRFREAQASTRVSWISSEEEAQGILTVVSERIREISEARAGEPVSAERVWFASDPGAVYVDYRVGTTLWRRLVRVIGAADAPSGIAILGVFAPAGGEWTLARGTDLDDPTPTALYEYDAASGQWTSKPLAEGPRAD